MFGLAGNLGETAGDELGLIESESFPFHPKKEPMTAPGDFGRPAWLLNRVESSPGAVSMCSSGLLSGPVGIVAGGVATGLMAISGLGDGAGTDVGIVFGLA